MTTAAPPNRLVTGLLIAITVLLAVLVIGLAVGGILAARYLPEALDLARDMHREIRGMHQDLKATRDVTQKLSAEVDQMQRTAREAALQLTERQTRLGEELQDRAKRTHHQMDGIVSRRSKVPEQNPFNPFAKLDVVADLNRIMADELVILNRHLAETQSDLATMMRPLPIQQKLKTSPQKPRAK